MDVILTLKFVYKTCGTCGIIFYVPQVFEDECLETGKDWYCPNGHSRVYTEPASVKYKRLYEQTLKEKEKEREYRINSNKALEETQKQLEECQTKGKKKVKK
jgi:hypothetical protein